MAPITEETINNVTARLYRPDVTGLELNDVLYNFDGTVVHIMNIDVQGFARIELGFTAHLVRPHVSTLVGMLDRGSLTLQ
jgi:hypothetical protein